MLACYLLLVLLIIHGYKSCYEIYTEIGNEGKVLKFDGSREYNNKHLFILIIPRNYDLSHLDYGLDTYTTLNYHNGAFYIDLCIL